MNRKGYPGNTRAPAFPVGTRFGRLSIVGVPIYENGKAKYRCACECGESTIAFRSSLIQGTKKSCGCLHSETSRATGKNRLTHGMTGTRTYYTWASMIGRCTSPSHHAFRHYGGRGITVCARWLESFDNFFSDMGERPSGMTIGRKENDGNYEPNNCRWETGIQQGANRRNNRVICVRGQNMTVMEAVRMAGVPHQRIYSRLNAGWSPDRAVLTPQLRPNYRTKK